MASKFACQAILIFSNLPYPALLDQKSKNPGGELMIEAVPRTRSGKIMRRVLKSLVKDEPIGDITTIENPECVGELKKLVGYKGIG